MRVLSVTAARIASTSAVRPVSGATTGIPPPPGARSRTSAKPYSAIDALVAMADEGVGEQEEKVVGAGAADDAIGIEAIGRSDRLAQAALRAVGIDVELRPPALR
jgi:hypothetical protein